MRIARLGDPGRPFSSLALTTGGETLTARFFETGLPPRAGSLAREPEPFTCRVTPGELRELIAAAGAVPAVARGGRDTAGRFSFAIVDTGGGAARVFEALVGGAAGGRLLDAACAALRRNPCAAGRLAPLAGDLEAPAGGAGGEVTGSVAALFHGFSHDVATRRVAAVVRILNRSRAPIPPPLVVVLRTVPATVRLADPDGCTCRVYAPGSPYVVVSRDAPLAPGEWVERPLVFDNPLQESFEIERRVFSGLADR